MNRSDRPTAAGVFVVRDPQVCAALETMLAPHRTDHTPDRDCEIMHRARTHLATAKTINPDPDSTIEDLLDLTYSSAYTAGHSQGASEQPATTKETQDRLREAETSLSHTERDLDQTRQQLQDALDKIAELKARPSGRRPTVSAQRQKDQAAFADLAARMDREALSQTKTPAAVLRMAATSVRDEIAIVYGNADRKAS